MITSVVLSLLVDEDRLWAVDELVRELGDRVATLDAIAELDRAGLANRIGRQFVFASRAALHADKIDRGA